MGMTFTFGVKGDNQVLGEGVHLDLSLPGLEPFVFSVARCPMGHLPEESTPGCDLGRRAQ